ncbi:hypothetical protein OF83DRAFT_149537 [Amylostereum chailletii]|nr:hypothetical protein OF83DRAFT_149537 [Amylostereum chailletii]
MFSTNNSTSQRNRFAAVAVRVMQKINSKVSPNDYICMKRNSADPLSADDHKAPLLIQAHFKEVSNFTPVASPHMTSCIDKSLVPSTTDDFKSDLLDVSPPSKLAPSNIGLGLLFDALTPSALSSSDFFSFGHFFQGGPTNTGDEEDDDGFANEITMANSRFLGHFFKVSADIAEGYNGVDHLNDHTTDALLPITMWGKLSASTFPALVDCNVVSTTPTLSHTPEAQCAVFVEVTLGASPIEAAAPIDPLEGHPTSDFSSSLGEEFSLLEAPKIWTDTSSCSSTAPSSLFTAPPSPAILSTSEIFSTEKGSLKPGLQTPRKASLTAEAMAWMKRTIRRRV